MKLSDTDKMHIYRVLRAQFPLEKDEKIYQAIDDYETGDYEEYDKKNLSLLQRLCIGFCEEIEVRDAKSRQSANSESKEDRSES